VRWTGRKISAFALGIVGVAAVSAGAQQQLKSRTFRFSYVATVRDIPPGAGTIDVWLPFPQTDVHQTIHQVSVKGPGVVTIGREPEHANQALYLRVEQPRELVSVELDVTATRQESVGERGELTPAVAARYLAPEPLVPLDGPVKALAVEATQGKRTDAEKARAIYEKVTQLLKYDKSGTGWGRGDALYACDAKRGNCTDFHALIIGMARSQGIPARFAIGFPLPAARGAGEIPGYHCWAELHVKGRGWVPVDSSEAAKALVNNDIAKKDYFYGHLDENRIEFSRGRNLKLAPEQKSGPLNFFVYPHVEVDGKKHEAVERKLSFTDL